MTQSDARKIVERARIIGNSLPLLLYFREALKKHMVRFYEVQSRIGIALNVANFERLGALIKDAQVQVWRLIQSMPERSAVGR